MCVASYGVGQDTFFYSQKGQLNLNVREHYDLKRCLMELLFITSPSPSMAVCVPNQVTIMNDALRRGSWDRGYPDIIYHLLSIQTN